MSKILRSPRKNNRSVLDNYQSSSTPANPQQDELNQLVSAQSNPGQTVLGVSTRTDPTVQTRITALTATLGASGLDTAKAYAKKVQLGAIATTANFPNAVYQGGPFDIEIDFTAGGRTVVRRLERCLPGIPLRPKSKTSRAGASRRPRPEARAGRQDCRVDGQKGRRETGSDGRRGRFGSLRKNRLRRAGSLGFPPCLWRLRGAFTLFRSFSSA